MKKNEVLSVLNEDMANGNGEILDVGDIGVSYLDYSTDITTTYMFEEAITDDEIKNMIHIGKNASTYGLTKDYIVSVVKKAFGDDYYDAVCTLSGIIIPSDKNEFYDMLEKTKSTSDDMSEWYDWEDEADFVGHMFSTHQIALINERKISDITKELYADKYSYNKEYQIGIITTLIHEIRHLMLETNMFLPEDEFPESEKDEDMVEEFCRLKYETLGDLKFWK